MITFIIKLVYRLCTVPSCFPAFVWSLLASKLPSCLSTIPSCLAAIGWFRLANKLSSRVSTVSRCLATGVIPFRSPTCLPIIHRFKLSCSSNVYPVSQQTGLWCIHSFKLSCSNSVITFFINMTYWLSTVPSFLAAVVCFLLASNLACRTIHSF